MQVCENGHIITENYNSSPEFRKQFCTVCGAKTITTCPSCGENIKGEYHVEGVISFLGGRSEPPKICEFCGNDFPWRYPKVQEKSIPKKAEPNERRLALVIGCADYEYGGKLANPINDVQSIQSVLKELGFDVMIKENPNLKEMKIAIDDYGIELEKYDVGLFYFAGHGVQVKGLNYLIPVDANLKSERVVEYDCVHVDRVLSHMEACKTDVNLIILDACRENPFARSWGRGITESGLASMDAPKGSLIAYSTSPGKTASDGTGKNGLYTGELISEVTAVNTTINQMFQNVRKQVMIKSNDEQIPWESTSLIADFYFNKK